MIKAVIFDMDGTLLDTLEDLMYSTNYALEKFGLKPRTKDEIRSFVGNGVDKLIERAMNNEHMDIYSEVLETFKEHYMIHSMDHIYAYDGIIELLKELKKKNLLIGVVTNKFDSAAKDIVDVFFKEYVDITVGVKDGINKKPSPDMCNIVLNYFNITSDEAIFLGDSDVDYKTAVNSKLFPVSCSWGFKTKEFLVNLGSKNIIDKPMELLNYLDPSKKLDKILEKYPHVGATIIHTTNKEIDYECFSGYENLEEMKKTNSKTIYRIASISKIVIALGIMKLYEQGLVDIYIDVSKYLGFSLRNKNHPSKEITLEMIMTQTSSLCDLGDETCLKGYDGVNGYTYEEVKLTDLLVNENSKYYSDKVFLKDEPGTKWNYSNFGCGILACVIEKVTNMPYDDFLEEHIFKKLDIDASYMPKKIIHYDDISSLYEYDEKNNEFIVQRTKKSFIEKAYPVYELGENFRGPAGGLFISGESLSKIMLMLMNNGTYNNEKIFEESTIKEMKKTHWIGVSDCEYKKKGLQLLILDGYSKEDLYGHFGNAYGLRSFMLFNKNNGYIFLCNGASYGEYNEHIVDFLKEVLECLIAMFE